MKEIKITIYLTIAMATLFIGIFGNFWGVPWPLMYLNNVSFFICLFRADKLITDLP